jgi:transcriptional regulator with XRE-family HTH domain
MFAKKIRALMAERGISQVELAKKAGLNKVHLNQILTGKKVNLRHATLEKIANALGVNVADLFISPLERLPEQKTEAENAEPLNDRTKKAQHFFRAKDVPEEDKEIIEKLIELHEERAKKRREEGGKDSEDDPQPDI